MDSVSSSVVDLDAICKSMPKLELHAHLSGSVSDEILMKLKSKSMSQQKDAKKPADAHSAAADTFINNPIRNLDECWKKFGEIHELIRNVETLHWVTCQVIGEFVQDRVIYLELRTSPKKIHGIPSKEEYLRAVVKAILDSQKEYSVIVKLLVSIDRKMDAKDQQENVQLAIQWANKFPSIVIGMDLSGHPKKGSLNWILPLLEKARNHGLRLSCHLSEAGNVEENERIMKFNPERVAHAVYMHPSLGGTEQLWQLLKELKPPVEVCITSNIMAGITSSVESHYVRYLHEESLPYVIGTDDSGVFQTTVSAEYQKLLRVVPLSVQQLKDLSIQSVLYAFASEDEKQQLRSCMMQWWDENVPIVKGPGVTLNNDESTYT